ncbi:hypothetical protein BZA05DRAFT_425831 [Tricharina praecox]|uniref:uncharacterized protein n=1 Tax=Tricharina praecox TaxID=43433 RepID=UPI00221F99D1|nr:uncharacterized protein BZA05DRAFT_425831 [Tricharina praecox]KAI5851039.1 hypothetical protein BZA05DRAFT_425831 [Tricharina praecox]
MHLGGERYQFIAVGTGAINHGVPFGRLVILTLHQGENNTVAVRRRYHMICDDTVYSVAPYGTSSLVCCTGNMLCFKDFNAKTKKLEIVAQVKLRSPAVQISVSEPLICVSCAMDSVLVIKYENGRLFECFSDEIARNGFYITKLLEDLLIATDKQYGVVGLWRPPIDNRALQSLKTIFEAELDSSVSRIRRGICRPPWVPHDRHLPGIVGGGSNLIAAGVDGSFFQLTVIDESALRLLQLLQDLYRPRHQAEEAYMMVAEDMTGLAEWERDPTKAHINGDALAPIVELGAPWLREAVARAENTLADGFVALARRTVNPKRTEDVFEAVINWVDGLLNDAVL